MPQELRAAKSDRIATMALDYLDERLTHPDGNGEQDTSATAPCPTPSSKTPIVAAFWSFGSEVDTRPIIAGIVVRGWRLALPCMVRTSRTHPSQRPVATMRFLEVPAHRIDEAASLFAAKPIRSHSADESWMATFPAVPIPDIDAFVVPLVAFDDDGNRLGYGGGNYDRALPLASPDATVVGVAFAEQRVTSVPVSEYDVPIPVISA
ncbi:hypothetical protein H6A11_04540 [Bifidobacterium pullorum subsp. saeculare]|uniref:5-formyltetrahydrofolate cyclo-ligase n=1 Tax=Bifidobacterium pullorum TaxID=78448 RepID=UPI00195BBC0D|nr:5-formyltetrahydrofolate cyclo-ligase [Bifidobacterium pullorum]MBM6696303.1 hypothetical protein [Bifidobacterium pullorum subsp. saeculare]